MNANQNDIRFLETDYIYRYTKPNYGGTGSASTLPISEEEAAAAEAKRIPLGFTLPPEKPKRKRRAKA